jgi:hypothetical protein
VTAGIVVSLGVSGNIDVNVLMQGACLVSLDGLLVSSMVTVGQAFDCTFTNVEIYSFHVHRLVSAVG